MPQPVRAFTDGAGDVWLALDNGHRIRLPLKGSSSGGDGSGGGNEVFLGPEPPEDPSIELWVDTDAEDIVLDQDAADGRYVNADGDTMTGNLDARGAKVGLIWSGSYYGVQSKIVAGDGTGGSALLLGAAANDNVYLIAGGAGTVTLRPGPGSASTNDVKVAANQMGWPGYNVVLYADANGLYVTNSAVTVYRTLAAAAPTLADHVTTKDYVDKKISGKIATGSVSVPVVAGNGGSHTAVITFPAGYFPVTPFVVVTPNNARLTCAVNSASKDTANIGVFNWTTASTAGAGPLNWIAYDP